MATVHSWIMLIMLLMTYACMQSFHLLMLQVLGTNTALASHAVVLYTEAERMMQRARARATAFVEPKEL